VVTTAEPTVKFLGITPGGEIFGGTQANFAVDWPDTPAKELSILLNDPAAVYAAEKLGRENTPAFRDIAAERIGLAFVARLATQRHRLDSVTFITRAMLEADPALLAALEA
jgi:hypothetical protein